MENPEYRWKPEMVTPRHSPQGKAVTSTKGHPSGVVACSELQANEPAEAAEMTARRTLRVRNNVGCKASTVHKQQADQWEVLLAADTIAAATVAVAPGFQDRMTNSGGFFNIPKFTGITFVVTNAIDIASTAAYGLMYAPSALAVDTRKQFDIEPQRDASKQAWELNASMWYVAGVWNKKMGVLLRHNASTPS